MALQDEIGPALTTSTAAHGSAVNDLRFYIPVDNHSISFADNPFMINMPKNIPDGILDSDVNDGNAGFHNNSWPYGRWDFSMSMRGTLQRVKVGGLLHTDATDASGNLIDGNVNYQFTDGTYGLTGDQMRKELLRLGMQQHHVASGTNGITNTSGFPLMYMYPHFNYSAGDGSNHDQPEFFRGVIRNINISDEVGQREGYDFQLTFVVSNVTPVD